MSDNPVDCKQSIVSCFNADKLRTLDLKENDAWKLPRKLDEEINTRMQYDDLIPDNISISLSTKFKGHAYDTRYLKNIFTKIETSLSDGIPESELANGDGFVFPRSKRDKDLHMNQLWNKQLCTEFISNICQFKAGLKSAKDAVKTYYLLGHVGSGKSTFLNHIYFSNLNQFKQSKIITVRFEYREISSLLYEQKLPQEEWNEIIQERLFTKIINNNSDSDKKIFSTSTTDRLNKIANICAAKNIIIFLDGFDSLSPNVIERQNAKMVLAALIDAIKLISDIYDRISEIEYETRVLFCLRKCTYDSFYIRNKNRRVDSKDAYFLFASEFDDVITKIISILSKDSEFLSNHQDIISDIIIDTSSKIMSVLPQRHSSKLDVFDNNYRRRLRYIASVIIVNAIRVSNNFGFRSADDDIHNDFLCALNREISESKKDYLITDILVYGTNTGYNNHFSDINAEYNIGKLCGFADNIFWYFNEPDILKNNIIKFIIKLRVLQILNRQNVNGKFNYLTKAEMIEELSNYGYSVSDMELFYVLDFLEKSLFVRSRGPYNNKSVTAFSKQELGKTDNHEKEIDFKCSNFGSLFIDHILTKYSYISAVCQNTVLPNNIADRIRYQKKNLAEPGTDFFIDKNWTMSISAYLIYFLRVIKSVELSTPKARELYVHHKMIDECRKATDKILQSKNNKLTATDLIHIEAKCKSAANYI